MFTFLETPRLWVVATPQDAIAARLAGKNFSLPVQVGGTTHTVFFPAAWPGDALAVFPQTLAWLQAGGVQHHAGGMLVEKTTRTVVGQLGFKGDLDTHGRLEVGYGLNPDVWGRGLCTEALRAVIQHEFGNAMVKTIQADTAQNNLASQRVLQKNGFVRVGEGYDPEDGPLFHWVCTREHLRDAQRIVF